MVVGMVVVVVVVGRSMLARILEHKPLGIQRRISLQHGGLLCH